MHDFDLQTKPFPISKDVSKAKAGNSFKLVPAPHGVQTNDLNVKVNRRDFSEDELALMDARIEQLRSSYQATDASVSSITVEVFSHISRSSEGGPFLVDIPLKSAAAALVIGRDLPIVIADLRACPAFKDHVLVKGPPFSRFYAAVSVKTTSGIRVGVVAVTRSTPDFNFKLKDAEYLQEEAEWYGSLFSSAIDRRQSS